MVSSLEKRSGNRHKEVSMHKSCGKTITAILAATCFICMVSCKKDFSERLPVFQASGSMNGQDRPGKPNIILIIGDDVGYEIPTYNGGGSYNTPNLDSMAFNGIQFPDFFSHPDGPPSRLALVTGKYNYRNWEKFGYLPPDSKTFANMLQNAGYSTCFVGKWQFDGGDHSIRDHGFDKYLVFMPFNPADNNGHDQFYRRYKNPYLYKNARYLDDSEVRGKYSEDMFLHYAGKFIDSNKSKPFLLVYSHTLVQKPFVPTPDDPGFANWNPATDDDTKADKKYFPEMVEYMDKIVGKLLKKVQQAGLSNITYIMFTSDNATHKSIRSLYRGNMVKGGKDSTTRSGINVPFIVYRPGTIAPGVVDTSLVDMTDFLPTFADIAGTSIPNAWGPFDGTTFYDNLKGVTGAQRNTVYCYWPTYNNRTPSKSFVYDYDYKLYDSLNGGYFFNIRNDVYEQHPLRDKQLTPFERQVKTNFQKILTDALSY